MFLCYVNKSTFAAKGKTATKYEFLTEERKPVFTVDWESNTPALLALAQRTVYDVEGTLDAFKGEPRIKIVSIVPVPNADVGKFIKISSIPKETLIKNVYKSISGIKNEMLCSLAEMVLEEEHERFFSRPAAKSIHHGWVSGLAEHSYCVMVSSQLLAGNYKYVFPGINDDLIIFGSLFHDLGKIDEYSSDGIITEFTPSGEMIPHPVGGCLIIAKHVEKDMSESDKKLVEHIYHIIASHHGHFDAGAPVLPKSPEAIIISTADGLDAELIHAHGLMQTATGEFTEKSKAHDKAYLVTR
jgi:3'-5' exoribonuclease